jgi:1,4-dihydroxy-2-naphthoyl-CoA hydrolase
MTIWQQPIDLVKLNERGKNSMSDYLGIEIIRLGDDYLIGQMLIDHRHRQPFGIMHGGASCVLAETVGSIAANFCVDADHYCVGLDINTNHIRAISEGKVMAMAMPFHLGKTTQVWSIDIKDEQDKRISINRLTMAVLKRKTASFVIPAKAGTHPNNN